MLNVSFVFSRSFFFAITLVAAVTVLPGCFGLGSDRFQDEDRDNDRNDDSNSRDDDQESDGDKDNGGQTSESCVDPDDCLNIACLCDDGSSLGAPVNARHCTNQRCETASQACPDACAAFGYGWTGSVVGASDDGNDGSGNDGNPSGSTCDVASDCAAHSCSCPDGTVSDVRDCYDNVCYGADFCAEQCCALGHC